MRLFTTVFALTILFQIVLASAIPLVDAADIDVWDNSWSFHETILLDFNTGEKGLRNQPVDMHVVFSNPCWARDEHNNSIRVVVKHDNKWEELESQVYNLSFVDDCHINACNLVFLIPSFADGNESYYVYYDDEEEPSAGYPDHVSVKEDYFYYEPISGYRVDLRYYKVTEDGCCLYGVGLDGEITGLGVTNKVIKQRNDATDFSPRNWVQIASFAFFYAVKGTTGVGTDRVLLSKEILVDGNLMVCFRISSGSEDGKLRTDAMYTYYYCPTEDKKIIVDVKDEVLKEAVSTGTAAQGGSFAYLASSKTRSANIRELNSGFIPPYVHFFSEQNIIQGYPLPQNPHSSDYDWVLSPQDDADLGSRPWVSLDEGKEGYAYAIILSSSKGLYSTGRDGIQITAGSEEFINIPGSEMDGGGASLGRNSVEPGEREELVLPKGLRISFSSEFFYTENGGYPAVDEEARVFQTLEKHSSRGFVDDRKVGDGEKKHSLKIIPSLQGVSRPLLAAVFAFPVPTVEVRVYKGNELVASGLASRSYLFHLPESLPKEGKGLLSLFLSILRNVKLDAANVTLLQQVVFPNLVEGRYLVKVFLNIGNRSKYIGYKSVDLNKNLSCMVSCKPEKNLIVNVEGQDGRPVKGVVFQVVDKEKVVVTKDLTDENGRAELSFPLSPYCRVQAIYKGLQVYNEEIKPFSCLPFLNKGERKVVLHLYDVRVSLMDSLDLVFNGSVNPFLTSQDGVVNTTVKPTISANGEYIFTGLPRGRYQFFVKYKSFVLSKELDVEKNLSFVFNIPSNHVIKFRVVDNRGTPLVGAEIKVSRNGVVLDEKTNGDGDAVFILPPGRYSVEVVYNAVSLAKQVLKVSGDERMVVATDFTPFYVPVFFAVVFAVGALFFLFVLIKKLGLHFLFLILSIMLLVSSVFLPLWVFDGVKDGYSVYSNIFVFPPSFITFKQADGLKTGEIAEVPDLFTRALQVVSLMVLLEFIMVLLFFIIKKGKIKWFVFCLSLFFAVSSVIATYLLISQLTAVTLGSVSGEGFVDFSMPDGAALSLPSAWGFGSGWFFLVLSMVSLVFFATFGFFRKKG